MSAFSFEWDAAKDLENQAKHGVAFDTAKHAFADSQRLIADDLEHSWQEKRFYCFGRVANRILTVRFTYRQNAIRIIGAGYWRRGRAAYEKENQIH